MLGCDELLTLSQDPATGMPRLRVEPLECPIHDVADYSVTRIGRRVYVFGGSKDVPPVPEALSPGSASGSATGSTVGSDTPVVLLSMAAGSPLPDDPSMEFRNTLHVYDIDAKTWQEMRHPPGTPWPSARASHMAFTVDGLLVIAGGTSENYMHEDTWVYEPGTAPPGTPLPDGVWGRVANGDGTGAPLVTEKKDIVVFGSVAHCVTEDEHYTFSFTKSRVTVETGGEDADNPAMRDPEADFDTGERRGEWHILKIPQKQVLPIPEECSMMVECNVRAGQYLLAVGPFPTIPLNAANLGAILESAARDDLNPVVRTPSGTRTPRAGGPLGPLGSAGPADSQTEGPLPCVYAWDSVTQAWLEAPCFQFPVRFYAARGCIMGDTAIFDTDEGVFAGRVEYSGAADVSRVVGAPQATPSKRAAV
ncbi:hypothetical protein KIPB_001312 [Kipferlia bialata]|uniref:Uncharacterized protein n=1 Tax=Kipferlia bialata TaxID=797122 RepID=A0A9K3GE20_9EUKA|nr:hypothetical protein KIPB_001312 [Kipferlia bialata]|eukprot:g1312.t1